ncbi:unnamed protein product [Spirodela intermedia]|uniref:Uncharacterized protein n=1 Tax=Spirodela intermedia TaxID=51605 RepID=A0A7I8L8K1_SPIIN|nr:unnamed protein product [Spirodela intermedia]
MISPNRGGAGTAVLQLLAGEDQPLLVRGNALLVLDLGLYVVYGVGGLNLQDLHPTTETEDKVKGGLLLDVVIGEGTAVLQLLAGEDQPLLVRGNALLVLDLGLYVVDGVGGLNLQGDGLAGEGLHEDLHPTTETEDKVKGGLLLDVVIGEGTAVLQLLAGEDQPLLVRGNALLVLDLGLYVVDGVGGLNLQGDGLAGEGLHEDLHPTTETENKVKGGLLLDVVIGEGTAVLQLLAGEDQPLLVRGNALLVLDLGLYVVDGVGGLNLQGDGLAGFHDLSSRNASASSVRMAEIILNPHVYVLLF